jgi:hypothetical protein
VLPSGLDDREADNWTPLVAIAEAIGGDWPTRARRTAAVAAGLRDEDEPGLMLLADLRALFDRLETDRLATDVILNELANLDGRPWPEWSHGKPISARALAKLLKPFSIEPRTIRWPGGSTIKGYSLDWFEDAFARFLPPYPSHPTQPVSIAGETPFSEASQAKGVTGSKTPSDPHQSRQVTDVTDNALPDGANGQSGASGEYDLCPRCGARVLDWGGPRICTGCRARLDAPPETAIAVSISDAGVHEEATLRERLAANSTERVGGDDA